jgi:hypothetical protein
MDVPIPKPASGQLLVKVPAAGLNPVDYKTRKGVVRLVEHYKMPAVMGNELAGEVVACSPHVGVQRIFALLTLIHGGEVSRNSLMFTVSIGLVKLGQPHPDLNLSDETNKGSPETIST